MTDSGRIRLSIEDEGGRIVTLESDCPHHGMALLLVHGDPMLATSATRAQLVRQALAMHQRESGCTCFSEDAGDGELIHIHRPRSWDAAFADWTRPT